MKRFKFVFHSGKEHTVDADSWEIHDDSYMFYKGNRAMDGFNIPITAVESVTVLSEDLSTDNESVKGDRIEWIAGYEAIYSGAMLFPDHAGIDVQVLYGRAIRKFVFVFQPKAVGEPGIYFHNYDYGMVFAFNRWGGEGDSVIYPPIRFADLDLQRFELTALHRKIGPLNEFQIQIVAVPENYAGPYQSPKNGPDQPPRAKP